ncbi:MAG: HvfC/BufC family peptide modification chaperone [Steroidobacteraceae bacterium]
MTPGPDRELHTLERWMQAVVMHPGGATAGLRSRPARRLIPRAASVPETVVLPSKALTSVERLDIYARMYYARLLEILVAEYPTARQILGPRKFAAACRRFIARNPSRSRTLNRLSEKFPDFLARALPKSDRCGLAVDVARIERAMEDVFDAPRAEPLTAARFAAIGADQWERARLTLSPALRLLKLRYPANDYMNAVRSGKKPRIPRPRASFAIVHRRGFQVFRREQEPEQFKLLAALASGRALAAAVRASVGGRSGSADRLAARLGAWFREWAAAGIFTGPSRAGETRS